MRILRIAAITLGSVVALILVGLVALALSINPNDYRGRIAAAVQSSTGRTLALPGDLKLSVFPWIALELGPASLGNPPGFDAMPFASVTHAVLRVKLLPLLRRQLQIGRIEIDGLDLRLRTNAQGQGNWASGRGQAPAAQSAGGPELAELGGLKIRDSRISYQDMVVDHLDVDVGRVAANVPVPVRLQLQLARPGAAPMSVASQFELTPDPARAHYRLDRLALVLDDSHLQGSAVLSAMNALAVNFDLTLDKIDIDRYLSSSAHAAAPPVAPPPARPAAATASASPIPALNGTLAIGSATVTGVTATQISLRTVTRDGILHIAPVKAKLYGGDYAGDITVDARGAVPALDLEQTVTGVDVAQLLQHFAKTQRFSGRGNMMSTLSARGDSSAALLRSLKGHIAADLTNGAIEGLDLWFEINQALAMIQKQALPSGGDSGRTRFDTFKASAEVAEGIATTHDLAIVSQNLQVNGQGTSNLVSGAIDYRLQATLRQAPGADARRLADVPLTVSGTMSAPKVRPDVEGLAKARMQQELDKRKGELQQRLEDTLKGLLK
jgi:uncharacterized protein involved in outer membrane biogenesis